MNSLKSIECDPDCGFKVRSHDEREVMNMAKDHVSHMHHKDVPLADLRKMMKSE
jgi:predicted small metal-binding protein